jgi:hypothetical protein
MAAKNEWPIKHASKANAAVKPIKILMNLVADAVVLSMSLRICVPALSIFITHYYIA